MSIRRSLCCLVSITVGLQACGARQRTRPRHEEPTPWDYAARGDKVIASDPGRALANYAHAAAIPGDHPPALAEKIQFAASQWLHAEVERRRPGFGAAPENDLRLVDELRRVTKQWNVPFEQLGIDDLEERAARALWARHLASIPTDKSPYEVLGYLRGGDYGVPETVPVLDAEVKASIARAESELVARNQALIDHAPSSAIGARLLYRTVLDALQQRPVDKDARAQLAKRTGIDVTASVARSSCDAGVGAIARAALPSGGDVKVAIRIEGVTCSAGTERIESRTKTVSETYTVSEEFHDTIPRTCVPKTTATCYEKPNRPCPPREMICTEAMTDPKPQYRQRKVEGKREIPVKERIREGVVDGTLVIETGGKVTRETFHFPVKSIETISDDPQSGYLTKFSPQPPSETIRSQGAHELGDRLKTVIYTLQHPLRDDYLRSAENKLAAKDLDGAADDLMIAIAGGVDTIPPSFAPLAAAAGMPFKAWDAALHGWKPDPPEVVSPPYGKIPELHYGGFDEIAEAEVAVPGVRAEQRDSDDEPLPRDPTSGRSGIGLGLSQWHPPNGENTWGATALYGRSGLHGNKRFWSYEVAGAAEIQSSGVLGLEGLLRGGVGVRTSKILADVHAVGGVAYRGETNESDIGLPSHPEIGFGFELVLAPFGARRFELLVERLSRLGADDTESPLRLRYELRYVRGQGDDALGAKGWCSFEQSKTSDVITPASTNVNRACVLAGFYLF